jgi:hypothetical protein
MKGTVMRTTSLLVALIPLSLAVTGCGGLGGELTDIICDCTHCDDWREEKLIAGYDTSLEIAEIYGCDPEWESLMGCQIDRGECDEDDASWSVYEKGSCSGSLDLMTPCTTDAQCVIAGSTCNGTTCVQKACSGANTPCASDSDCPVGEDKCEDEREDLFECLDDGADDDTYIGAGS